MARYDQTSSPWDDIDERTSVAVGPLMADYATDNPSRHWRLDLQQVRGLISG